MLFAWLLPTAPAGIIQIQQSGSPLIGYNAGNMTPEEAKAIFDDAATQIWEIRSRLSILSDVVTRPEDVANLKKIGTDLLWAIENCTVMGLHQIGEALDDDMGYFK